MAENVPQPTILVEDMHGFAFPLSQIVIPGLVLRMTSIRDVLLKEPISSVVGMIKGPRTMLGRRELEQFALKYPGLIIAYVGRHPRRVLASDVSYSYDRDNAYLLTVHTCYGNIVIISMAASPLSTAVAAFVWVAAEAVLTGKLEVICQLTMSAGNTFQQRSGHTFTVEGEDVPTVFQQKRIAILGAGDIGLRVLQLFARSEAQIVYSARSAKHLDISGDIDFSPSVDALLETSEPIDILTIHLPSSVYVPLSKVRQVKVFIQTSSGRNIDEEGLLQALDEGRIQTAIADVFLHEGKDFVGSIDPWTGRLVQSKLNPFAHVLDTREDQARKKRLHALIEQKRLLLTPHIAYLEKRAIMRTLLFAIYNILSVSRSIIMQLQLL